MEQAQEQVINWLDEEAKNTQSNADFGEKLPALTLESGKITKFTVDFSQPFKKWSKTENGESKTKAIIPVTHKEEKKILWLNVKNPLYAQIIELGRTGQTEFRVSTTGTQGETRYTIVTED